MPSGSLLILRVTKAAWTSSWLSLRAGLKEKLALKYDLNDNHQHGDLS